MSPAFLVTAESFAGDSAWTGISNFIQWQKQKEINKIERTIE